MKARREAFINEYILTKNASESARRAGYSVKSADITGMRLLRNASVSKSIEEGLKRLREQSKVTQESVIQSLLNEAKTAERPADRIRAWELLGKHLNIFKDNVTITTGIFNQLIDNKEVMANVKKTEPIDSNDVR